MLLAIFFLTFGQLLTKEGLKRVEDKRFVHTHFSSDDEGEVLTLEHGARSFVLKHSDLDAGSGPPKLPIRQSGLKGSGEYLYRWELKPDEKIYLGIGAGYENRLREDFLVDGKYFNHTKNITVLGSIGYENKDPNQSPTSVSAHMHVPVTGEQNKLIVSDLKKIDANTSKKPPKPGIEVSFKKGF
ncbi:MAG: hypothetical protein FJZ61_00190 [Chlamydiae bacterium]|nr:hypothetical protein [Chlamydiota bacterium]